ncbi:hypothetical protein MNEG_14580, partial [Monoraphidium neglectum]
MIGAALFGVSAVLSGLAARSDADEDFESADEDGPNDARLASFGDGGLAVTTSKHLRVDHYG